MFGNNGKALECGRALIEAATNFSPADIPVLLAAGLDPGFDPRTNPVDRRIDRFLDGSYGKPWRQHYAPREPEYNQEERHDLEAGMVEVDRTRKVYDAALNELFRVRELYYHPTPQTTPEMLVKLSRQDDAAAKALARADEELSHAIAKVTTIKLFAQERRRGAAIARGR